MIARWISHSVTTVLAAVDFIPFVFLLLMLKRMRGASASGGTGIGTMTGGSTSIQEQWSVIAKTDQFGQYELSWSGTEDDRAWVRMVAPTN